MVKRFFMALLAASILALSPLAAQAQAPASLSDVAKVTLLPGWRTENGTHMAAIRITLADGWKTYWRSPGDAGIPPRFDWQGSDNLAGVTLHWPIPKVFYQNGLRTIGYSGDTVIPIEFTPTGSAQDVISLIGEMELGVCSEICAPMTVSFQADLLPIGTPDKMIRTSLANRPINAAQAGVGSVTCSIEPISDGLRINASIELPKQGPDEVVVIELPDQSIWIAEATSTRDGRFLNAMTEMVPPNGAPFLLSRSDVRITVLGDQKAVNIQGCSAS